MGKSHATKLFQTSSLPASAANALKLDTLEMQASSAPDKKENDRRMNRLGLSSRGANIEEKGRHGCWLKLLVR
jgi:hypothetical protein